MKKVQLVLFQGLQPCLVPLQNWSVVGLRVPGFLLNQASQLTPPMNLAEADGFWGGKTFQFYTSRVCDSPARITVLLCFKLPSSPGGGGGNPQTYRKFQQLGRGGGGRASALSLKTSLQISCCISHQTSDLRFETSQIFRLIKSL